MTSQPSGQQPESQEPLQVEDLLEIGRQRIEALALPTIPPTRRTLRMPSQSGGSSLAERRAEAAAEDAWEALAEAVDELVEVSLHQQALIRQLLGTGDAALRWADVVAEARQARANQTQA